MKYAFHCIPPFRYSPSRHTPGAKAKQSKAKEVFDEGAGRSLYALQIKWIIISTNYMLSLKITNETFTSYSG